MSLDKVWEMYGTEVDSDKGSEKEKIEKVTKTTEKTIKTEDSIPVRKTSAEPVRTRTRDTGITRARDTKITRTKDSFEGVFGKEDDRTVAKTARARRSTKPERKAGREVKDVLLTLRDWPWIDIIGISITAVMVLYVIFNFEDITSRLFNCLLLPLLSSLAGIGIAIVVLVVCILILRERRYNRRFGGRGLF